MIAFVLKMREKINKYVYTYHKIGWEADLRRHVHELIEIPAVLQNIDEKYALSVLCLVPFFPIYLYLRPIFHPNFCYFDMR